MSQPPPVYSVLHPLLLGVQQKQRGLGCGLVTRSHKASLVISAPQNGAWPFCPSSQEAEAQGESPKWPKWMEAGLEQESGKRRGRQPGFGRRVRAEGEKGA